MVETTFLHDKELGRPSGDVEIDQLLAEVRHRTDRNYQVVVHRQAASHLLRRRVVERMQLYLHVGGVAPWQVLTCANDRATIRAFLFGLINGHGHETLRESPAAEMRKRAMRAHEACYQAMVAHPEIAALQDDGALHDAIHDILRVDGGYIADDAARKGWQSIDSAPKDGRLVLLCRPGHPAFVGHWSDGFWVDTAHGVRLPELWASLPPVPAASSIE